MANEANSRAVQRGRRELYVIVGMLVLVMVGATALYKAADSGLLDLPGMLGTSNNGELIVPPQSIEELGLRNLDGSPFDFAREDGRWTLLVPATASCDEQCSSNLYLSRQARTALGRDMSRVERLVVTTAAPDAAFAELLASEHDEVPVVQAAAGALETAFADLSTPLQPLAQGLMVVVDPQGWMMMYYTPEHDGHAILDDMKFLLKYSPRQAEGPAE